MRREEIERRLEEAKRQLGDVESELKATKRRMNDADNELKATKRNLSDVESELKATKRNLSDVEGELKATRRNMSDVDNELKATRQDIRERGAEKFDFVCFLKVSFAQKIMSPGKGEWEGNPRVSYSHRTSSSSKRPRTAKVEGTCAVNVAACVALCTVHTKRQLFPPIARVLSQTVRR